MGNRPQLHVVEDQPVRLPPHNIEAEQSLLGGLLLDNSTLDRVAGIVKDGDFYRDEHRRIFRHVVGLIRHDHPADVVTVWESIQASNELEQCGGLAYLGEIANNTPSAANIRRYAEIVRDKAQLRRLAALAESAAARALAGGDPRQLVEEQFRAVSDLTVEIGRAKPLAVVDAASLVTEEAPEVNWLIRDLLPAGGLCDVSGPPGDGKTSIVLDMMLHLANGTPWHHQVVQTRCAYITAEHSSPEAFHRDLRRVAGGNAALDPGMLVSYFADEPIFEWRDGNYHDHSRAGWYRTDYCYRLTEAFCRSRPGLIVLDTVGMLTARGSEIDNDQQRHLALQLKRWASELKATVLTISHTNQSSTGDKLPDRLNYISRAGGNGFPGQCRWHAGVSRVRESDLADLGHLFHHGEVQERKLVAFGVSKHNEIRQPAWNRFSPAVFEIRPDGTVLLVVDGKQVAVAKRPEGEVQQDRRPAQDRRSGQDRRRAQGGDDDPANW